MSGYQIFNSSGAVVIDSECKGTYYVSTQKVGAVYDKGAFSFPTPWGTMDDMGWSSTSGYPDPNNLYWFKPNNGGKFLFDSGLAFCNDNAGSFTLTSSFVNVESGYRDIYNSAGQLVWSAVQAAKIPRVLGFYDIPPGYDLDNNIYSQNIGENTWLLSNNSPGYFFTDGFVTDYSGIMFYFSNGILQAKYLTRLAKTWSQTVRNYGIRIPYAIMPNL